MAGSELGRGRGTAFHGPHGRYSVNFPSYLVTFWRRIPPTQTAAPRPLKTGYGATAQVLGPFAQRLYSWENNQVQKAHRWQGARAPARPPSSIETGWLAQSNHLRLARGGARSGPAPIAQPPRRSIRPRDGELAARLPAAASPPKVPPHLLADDAAPPDRGRGWWAACRRPRAQRAGGDVIGYG